MARSLAGIDELADAGARPISGQRMMFSATDLPKP
ncbi:hypothetical protein ABID59_001620 [Bradyrhizobium sp. S3.3.6]